MDLNSLADLLQSLWKHITSASVLWALIGAIGGYFGKAYFDRRRAERMERQKRNAAELEKLYALAGDTATAFRDANDAKIQEKVGEYLAGFTRSALPNKADLRDILAINHRLNELLPKLKPQDRSGPWGLESQSDRLAREGNEATEAARRKQLRSDGLDACTKLQELLMQERRQYP